MFTRLTSRVALAIALTSLGLSACESAPAGGGDGGPGQDANALCVADTDCDDARFCNGVETCDPTASAADARGCVPAAISSPCAEGQACDEDADACTTLCEVTEDADGDGARATECGGDDCDDSDARRFPGNPEQCDLGGLDEDCDPATFGDRDVDGDGVVDAVCCNGDVCGMDCDDLRRGTAPGLSEVCNGLDDDCDGMVDEGVLVMAWPDADFDLHGDRDAASEMRCAGAFGFAIVADDCDDSDPSVHTAQVEICDGKDNDCDGSIDEAPSAVTWYLDGDGDGFGSSDPATSRVSCTPLVGYSLRPTDCDDTRAGVSPATPERCDGLDNDCNGVPDFYLGRNDTEDDDLDGSADMACPSGTDCDDRDPTSAPGSLEICDGRDNDCNGVVDDGTAMGAWWIDRDGDTFGDASGAPVMSCSVVRGHALRAGDCDDSSAARRPGARELCDGVDDDCDTRVDEGSAREPYYLDMDGDGLGAGEPLLACERPIDRVPNATDCDDTVRAIGAASLYYVDADGDGYGDPARSELACTRPPDRITRGGDCDDSAASVFPMSVERCGGGDEDCDGAIDEDPQASASCVVPFATAACVAGACAVAMCEAGRGDCSASVEGCETTLVDDPLNCGMCGRACGAGERCRQDECARVVEIAAGASHLCALLGTGEVSCWGANISGQLGRGTSTSQARPAVDDLGLVRLYTGIVLDDIIDIDSHPTADFTCAVRSTGEVLCWGDNGELQIGADAPVSRALRAVPIPGISSAVEVTLGAQHACARLTSGRAVCWGSNARGQLSSGSMTPARSGTPLPVMEQEGGAREITDAILITAGNYMTCFLHASRTRVSCAGQEGGAGGWQGQMGRGGSLPQGSYPIADDVMLPSGTMVMEMQTSGGSYDGFTCVRGASGPPICWGINISSPMGGSGFGTPIPTPVEPLLYANTTAFALGYDALFVAYENASLGPRVGVTGANNTGQLSLGHISPTSSPYDMLSPAGPLTALPGEIVVGRNFACALLPSGAVTCWANNTAEVFGVSGGTRTRIDTSLLVPNVP